MLDDSEPFISYMGLLVETSVGSMPDWTSQEIADLHASIGDIPTPMGSLDPVGNSGAYFCTLIGFLCMVMTLFCKL